MRWQSLPKEVMQVFGLQCECWF